MALSMEEYFDQEAFALVINIVKFIYRLALLKALLKSAFVNDRQQNLLHICVVSSKF